MNTFNFKIENTLFTTESLAENKDFIIHSIKRDYSVNCSSSPVLTGLIGEIGKIATNIIIIDDNIFNQYKDKLNKVQAKIYRVIATENEKSLDGVCRFLDFLVANKVSKANKIIAIGGGHNQEIAGFSAACYKRGMDWIFFPTTLLAMCDSCIGGKTSLNYKGVKNQLGFFEAPHSVTINTNFLRSLPEQDIKSGLGEILKLCIIAGDKALDRYALVLEKNINTDNLRLISLILDSLAIKKAVIERDEYDLNERKALNYGHTIGHAIESLTNYSIPHGLAVVVGMMFVNYISVECEMLEVNAGQKINLLCENLLNDNIKEKIAAINISLLIELLASDKKASGSSVQFVLLESPGVTKFVSIELNSKKLFDALNNCQREHFY